MAGQQTKFWETLGSGVSAAATKANLRPDLIGTAREITFYVHFGAGVTAGVIVIEEAHDPDFTGTWWPVATVNWALANKVHAVSVTGAHRALRYRITTDVVGGVANVYAIGN